jgi:hypothetical protein
LEGGEAQMRNSSDASQNEKRSITLSANGNVTRIYHCGLLQTIVKPLWRYETMNFQKRVSFAHPSISHKYIINFLNMDILAFKNVY